MILLNLFINFAWSRPLIVNVPWWSNQEIYVTGEGAELCNWKPNCLLMQKIAPHTFQLEIPDSSEDLQFKVTQGSWDNEAVASNGSRIDNFIFKSEQDQLVLSVENWANVKGLSESAQIDKFEFYSKSLLKNKFVRVYLPPDYLMNQGKEFPVLYMHDGQNLFDSNVGNFGMEWSVDETMNELIQKNKLESMIIVGIDSNDERTSEYNFNLKGKKYASFLVQELKPYIDRKYRTIKDREHTFIGGSSYGATISFQTAWTFSEIFSKALCISFPAHAQNSFIKSFLQNNDLKNQNTFFYFDHGLYGGDSGYRTHVEEFIQILKGKGIGPQQFLYKTFPFADHREVDWARRLPEIFETVF